MRGELSVLRGLPSESLRRFRALCREGNVPDPGFLTGIDDFHDPLVGHAAIAPDSNRLVFVLFGNRGKLVKKLLSIYCQAFDPDGPVCKDVDDDFTPHPFGFCAFLGGRDGNFEFRFGLAELPADDEEAQQQQKDVDHWGQLDGDRWRLTVREFHPFGS